jgi:gliding motility-associated-like protein
MKNKIFSSLVLCCSVAGAFAQNTTQKVLNTTGGTKTYLNITYDWSVGELALVQSVFAEKTTLNNGFLQTDKQADTYAGGGISVVPINTISPNNDGVNDTWVIENLIDFPINEVMVFDRAGRVVFQTKNYQNDWNGQFNGSPLAEDTYYFVLIVPRDGRMITKKGFITIVK